MNTLFEYALYTCAYIFTIHVHFNKTKKKKNKNKLVNFKLHFFQHMNINKTYIQHRLPVIVQCKDHIQAHLMF